MSGASEKLDLAPSGISHAIGKLREYYNDPFLLRSRMVFSQPRLLATYMNFINL
ncbi:hypothetical protein AB8964_12485 [Yersinia enterocolitica]|uniref:hypothetical protein n=1 Tax=Yersinia enterocolitica TaxID=630 RepID=UPI003D05EF7A